MNTKQKIRQKEQCGCYIICKQKTPYEITTSIYQRQHFLSGIGQFCGPCYMATTNTGIVMREFYEDYLF